jgi:DNA-binding response OmpR family regulator
MLILFSSIPHACKMVIMKEKILVVDNDLIISDMVKIVLENYDFDVKCASNSHDAIDVALQWSPNLILLDIRMPAINGFTITERIREYSSTPIILLSGTGEKNDLVKGFDAGARDYILKPFSSHELLAHVNALLRRNDTAPPRKNDLKE